MKRSLFIVPLMAAAGFAANTSMAAGPVASLTKDFFLCESSHTGQPITYSCRDYRVGDKIQRFYFHGGATPKAVATIVGQGVQSMETVNTRLEYPVRPPKGIPVGAQFMGSGICIDNRDRDVPCGVFAHKPARFPKTVRYMVFYDVAGKGAVRVDRQTAGPNPDAIPAELAYQIGLGLVQADCCRRDGLGYLKMALSLFPDFDVYRDTYNRYSNKLAVIDSATPGMRDIAGVVEAAAGTVGGE